MTPSQRLVRANAFVRALPLRHVPSLRSREHAPGRIDDKHWEINPV